MLTFKGKHYLSGAKNEREFETVAGCIEIGIRFYVFKDSVGEAGSGMLSIVDMMKAVILGVAIMDYDLTGQVAKWVPQGNVAANSNSVARNGQKQQRRLQQQQEATDVADRLVDLGAPRRADERRAAVRGATSDKPHRSGAPASVATVSLAAGGLGYANVGIIVDGKITTLGPVKTCTTRGSATRADLWPRATPVAVKCACHGPRGEKWTHLHLCSLASARNRGTFRIENHGRGKIMV